MTERRWRIDMAEIRGAGLEGKAGCGAGDIIAWEDGCGAVRVGMGKLGRDFESSLR